MTLFSEKEERKLLKYKSSQSKKLKRKQMSAIIENNVRSCPMF
jgi:hypothetical protein